MKAQKNTSLTKVLAFSLVSVMTVFANAQSTDVPSDCIFDPNDPFSKIETMPANSHYGEKECINTARYRSVHRLTSEELKSFFNSTELEQYQISDGDKSQEVFANFKHQNKFWVAVIPKERIQDTVIQFIPLFGNSPLFHGQLRLRVKPEGRPIRLFSQTLTHQGRESLILNDDIVYAEQGVRPQHHQEKFNIIHGLQGHYAIAFMIGSLTENTKDDIADPKNFIRQYVLKMNEETSQKVLTAGVDAGTKLRMTRVYNTLRQSCLNALFYALNRALGMKESSVLDRAIESSDPVWKLKHMGLIHHLEKRSRIENYTGRNSNDPISIPQPIIGEQLSEQIQDDYNN